MTDAPKTADQLLAEARGAWHAMHSAEANLRRLNGYRRKTPGMKDDAIASARAANAARATLDRILGGARG